jgi:hypothetical protein
MILIRDNEPKLLGGHKMAPVAMRTRLMARMTRTNVLVVVAGWKKEAAP